MMKQYEKYKDSGVEWMGQVPEHWDTTKYKHAINILSGYPFKSELFDNEYGFPLLRIRDITSGSTETFYNGEFSDEFIVKNGDVVVGMDGDFNLRWWQGGDVLLNQRCCSIKSNEGLVDLRFIHYLLPFDLKIINDLAYYTTVKHLSTTDVLQRETVLPPIAEQAQIVRFLDHQTNLIDTIIAKKQKLIELLKEKCQSVINEVVTKGLNLQVSMKDSGVEWLGQIPMHWKLQPLKYIVSLKGRLGWKGLKAEEYVSKGYGFLSTPDIKNGKIDFSSINYITEERYLESPEIMLEVDDVLLVKDGSTLGIVNIVRELPIPSTVNSSIGVLRVLDKNVLLPEYLHAQLSSDYIQAIVQQLKAGQGVPHLFQKDINNFVLILPPIEEQREIVRHLVSAKGHVNILMFKIECQIEKLKEYRQSIISEAVTGKIDVREWEPPTA
jgi:type I restriction enzyme S subunit